MIFGKTASGKTSLYKKLIKEWRKANPTGTIYVLDPKLMSGTNRTVHIMHSPTDPNSPLLNMIKFKLD